MPLVNAPSAGPAASAPSASQDQKLDFAPCQRTTFVAGKNDWLQIRTPYHYTNFDVCPDCFNTTIRTTYFARFFGPAAPRPATLSTRCDFSDLWIRIAFTWLFIQKAPDASLLGALTELQDQEGPCPNLDQENEEVKKGGKPSATRTWYCLVDPKTGGLVEDMTVCSNCVLHINTIAPCLRGMFAPAVGGQKVLATCDLMVPENERTVNYLDQILEVAGATLKTGYRDVAPLVEFFRKWASIPECPKKNRTAQQKCYTMPSTVPEFTVCEECYAEHVSPLYKKSPQPLILSQLSSTPQRPTGTGFVCQLYSPRLQGYFADACSMNDLQSLRQKLLQRDAKLQELRQKIETLQMQHQQQKMQAKYHYDLSLIQHKSALNTTLTNQRLGWSVPTNFSVPNASMAQGSQLEVQAGVTMTNIRMAEKEWADFWE